MAHLRVFGPPGIISTDGAPLRPLETQPKRLALLVFLRASLPSAPVRRDVLLETFWPERDAARARSALNQALYHLRRHLGEETVLSVGDGAVRVDRERLTCDLDGFLAAVEVGDGEGALELYAGDFLEGFHTEGAPGFERWLEEERRRLRRMAARTATTLAEELWEQGEGEPALARMKEALRLSPYDESAHRRILEWNAALGRRAEALAEYERFAAWLRRELEVEPDVRTRGLAERLREERTPPVSGSRDRKGADAAPASPGGPPAPSGRRPAPMTSRGGTTPGAGRIGRAGHVLRWAVAGGGVALLWAGLGLAVRAGTSSAPPPPPGRTALLPLAHDDDAGLEAVAAEIEASVAARLSSLEGVALLPASAVPDGVDVPRLTRTVARARSAGEDLHAWSVLTGQLSRREGRVEVRPVLVFPGREEVRVLPAVSVPSGAGAEVAPIAADRLVGALALRLDSLTSGWADALSADPGMKAFRQYRSGLTAYTGQDYRGARDRFREAARLDTAFVMARLDLGTMLILTGERDAVRDSVLPSVQAALPRMSAAERAHLEALNAELHHLTGETYRWYGEAFRRAPEKYVGPYTAAAMRIGAYEDAVDALDRVGPDGGVHHNYWWYMTASLHALGRHERELAVARLGRALHPTYTWLFSMELQALAALGRADEILSVIEEREERPNARWNVGLILTVAGKELLAHSRTGADRVLERAWEVQKAALQADPDWIHAGTIEAAYLTRRTEVAVEMARRLRRKQPDRVDRAALLALALAYAGERVRALDVLEDARPSPRERAPRWHLGRARVLAVLGRDEGAAEAVQRALADGMAHWTLRLAAPELRLAADHPTLRRILGRGGF